MLAPWEHSPIYELMLKVKYLAIIVPTAVEFLEKEFGILAVKFICRFTPWAIYPKEWMTKE